MESDYISTRDAIDAIIIGHTATWPSTTTGINNLGMATLLFCCHPLTGHFTPVVRIAAGLKQRGWRVAFLSSEFFRARIEAAGLQFLPLVGDAALDDASLFDRGSFREGVSVEEAAQLPQSVTDTRHQTLFALPSEWASLKAAITTLAGQRDDKILVVSEAFFYGAMPLKYGADFVCSQLLPRSVCISITAPAIRSVDLPPFGHPAAFATSDAERARLATLWDDWLVASAPLTSILTAKMREAGVSQRALDGAAKHMVFMGGANYVCHDAIAQVGVPEFEFPRTDFPPGFSVVGIVPPVVPSAPPTFSWWDAVVANHVSVEKKKVVVVAQGTVETDPRALILPTLQIVGEHVDAIGIAILGVKGASLAAELPRNSLVADYLSYDAILPYADVWVHNGGYGATTHGIAHGVPMVIAGDTQDKPENGKRVQACGLGVDLATAHPAVDDLSDAIRKVLREPSFARVAKTLQATHESMDCVGQVEALILAQMDGQPM